MQYPESVKIKGDKRTLPPKVGDAARTKVEQFALRSGAASTPFARTGFLVFLIAGLSVLLFPSLASAQEPTEGKIWGGVYTTVQAIRGKVNFTGSCERCHGPTLGGGTGPSLTGQRFMTTWENESVYRLFTKVRDTMPPNFGTSLTDEAKLDVVAYILQSNGYPAGSEELKIASDELETIRFVKKGQGAVVPNFSIVQAVGCLTLSPDNTWALTNTSEPVISRDQPSTPEELKAAGERPLGDQSFRLVSTAAFKPEFHRGHKVEVKGLVYRDAGENRINLTSLQMVGDNCSRE